MSLKSDLDEDMKVEKSNGEIIGPYSSMFTGTTIFIWDLQANIQEGDVLLRSLPNGSIERNIVTDIKYYKGRHLEKSHYQVKFTKNGNEKMTDKANHTITIHSAQSVQIGDHNTQNIINSIHTLKNQIESSSGTQQEKEEAKSLLSKFISHPLVTSILGAAAGAAIGL